MKNNILKIFVVLSFINLSCSKINIQEEYLKWQSKTIILPDLKLLASYNSDSISLEKYKILVYSDSIGCLSCKLQLNKWFLLNYELENNISQKIPTIYFVNTSQKKELENTILNTKYRYPIFIDYYDSLNKLNHFPSDERFHCFLLDENNRVILIGNPVQNPKIKDLYIRTICERLGIDTTNVKIAENRENRFSFGRFPFSETMKTNFVLKNDSLVEMKIDTIFMSCECTSASADKSIITQNDSAIISVTFKTEKPEEFSREIYVKTNLNEKPIVYTVDGEAY